jgi:hypothetical protein
MEARILIPIINVSSMDRSFAWFEKLGWKKRWEWGDPPDFGAVGSGGSEIFMCLDCQGGRGEDASWLAVMVDDPDAIHRRCLEQGIEVAWPPKDMEWNMREMGVRHPDGHVLRIGRPLEEADESQIEQQLRESGPPLQIERVDVPVRLEKRLAALLADLAEHKHMSLSSCLEEILLHTNEQLGEGVASPHTPRTLAHIRELRRKHGIDYDCHASYRFVETG